jgi:hypothetical protein
VRRRCIEQKALKQAYVILENLRPKNLLPAVLRKLCNRGKACEELAIRFWLEGAIGGNPLAQKALADELMVKSSQLGNEHLRVMASSLFALAAQQGDEGASESLARVIEYDTVSRGVETEEEFFRSPVVQAAYAAVNTCFDVSFLTSHATSLEMPAQALFLSPRTFSDELKPQLQLTQTQQQERDDERFYSRAQKILHQEMRDQKLCIHVTTC